MTPNTTCILAKVYSVKLTDYRMNPLIDCFNGIDRDIDN